MSDLCQVHLLVLPLLSFFCMLVAVCAGICNGWATVQRRQGPIVFLRDGHIIQVYFLQDIALDFPLV